MAYTPDFDYDIFISFSHRDNEPHPGQDTGWVERFEDYLEWWLGKRRGLKGLKIWWDKRQNLARNTITLSHRFRKTQILSQSLERGNEPQQN